jgi:CxxC motif-containing protein (DUF1111 family)
MAGRGQVSKVTLAFGRIVAAALASATVVCSPGRTTLAGDGWGLNADHQFRLALGQAVFRKLWVSAPASTTSSDGLGPLYNARACAQCHPHGGRGQPQADFARGRPSALVLRLSVPPRTETERALLAERRAVVVPHATYGVQLQPFAIQGHQGEGQLEVSYEEISVKLGDGEAVRLRKPSYRVTGLGYGPLGADVMISPRVAPPLIGLGLIEMVPQEQILEREGGAGTGVAGIANRVWSKEQGQVVLGRFGWKAGVPTVRQQVAEAFAIDLGISSSLAREPAGDCTPWQVRCLEAPDGRSARHGGHELGDDLLDLVTFYVANADVPVARPPAPDAMREGEALFHAIGCAACHRSSFRTSASRGPAHLRDRVIWPYSDLLLHDMGEDLADGRPERPADGRWWRTAPLWGAGRPQTPDGRQTFLHDGRARSIEEAVLWHGGEGYAARDAFARLTAAERRALVDFVKSL